MLIMINLDSALKKGDNTLSVKVCVVKATVFPVVYGCKIWTIKKAENQRINALSCDSGEDSWEYLEFQDNQISQS